MKRLTFLIIAVLVISSLSFTGAAPSSHETELPNHAISGIAHYRGNHKFPNVMAVSNRSGISEAGGFGGLDGTAVPSGALKLLPNSTVNYGNNQKNNSSETLNSTYQVNITFGTLPFSIYNGSWVMVFWFNNIAYYFAVEEYDYMGLHFDFSGIPNGTYYLKIGPIPYSYYHVDYPSAIVVNGRNQTVSVTFPLVEFEFEVYIVGIPQMTGLGLWTDYVGMNGGALSFPPFLDLTNYFFENSTAQYFSPATFRLFGASNQVDIYQSMIEAELIFYGAAGDTYFQYNVTAYLTNGTLIGGIDPAMVFNVTFSVQPADQQGIENLNGLYLPPGAVFDNVTMSFDNAPGWVSWNGVFGNYGGVSYGRYGYTQADLSMLGVDGSVGALNSLMSPYNDTGFSTFAFGWTGLGGGSVNVVAAYVPEYGTAVIPGYAGTSGSLFSSIIQNFNRPLNFSGASNVSKALNSTVLINDSSLYTFYNNYYPYYAYYDYFPGLIQAINLTMSSVRAPSHLPLSMTDFLPISEEGLAVGGWGWSQRWAYPILYPSVSYYGINISGLPSWMGTPYLFSDLNESFSMAYLLGNYRNLSYSFDLYFVSNGIVSPPWGGGEANISGNVNGSLPYTNLSYWLGQIEGHNQDIKRSRYPYYAEGWTPYLVINVSIPYNSPSVEFYSGAEAVVSWAANSTIVGTAYTYYNNGSYFWKERGWQDANSTLVIRLLNFSAPLTISSMSGIMRNDYVISYDNSSLNSITPYIVNYSNLPYGMYGSYADQPSEYVSSYIQYQGAAPQGVGQSGSVNFISFGSIRYVLSYALYPYPVPMVYAVENGGNSTYSLSNPFDYFSFHSYEGRTVFNVSVLSSNYTTFFNMTGAIGSTVALSWDNLTHPFIVNGYGNSPSPWFYELDNLSGDSFWQEYSQKYYPSLESANFTGRMEETKVNVTFSGGWTNIDVLNNQSTGIFLYVGLLYPGNYSVSSIFKWLGDIENTSYYNATHNSTADNITVNTTLTGQQYQSVLNNVSAYSYGSAGYAIIHVGYNDFSYNFNPMNETLLVRLTVDGNVVTFEYVNVSEIFYIYYSGVFGYMDSFINQANETTSPVPNSVPLWIFGIIPAVLLGTVVIHDVVNWIVRGSDADSIFFWRNSRSRRGGRQ